MTLLDPADLPFDDAKAHDALRRYDLRLVRSIDDPDFSKAYALLDAEFGAKGELETRDALAAYFARASDAAGYRLVVARDRDGAIVGVRDCHVSVDAAAKTIVVYLAHVLVLPDARRSGLASLFRALPASLGKRAANATGAECDVVLAAEMEPYVEGATDTLVRLMVYGKSGFFVVDPRVLPYCQPDYRAHAIIDADRLRPVPLLALVRWVGHETERTLPTKLAAAYVEHLYRIVAAHCRETDLAPPRAHALGTLERSGLERVGLLPGPQDAADEAALRRLSRDTILGFYPRSLIAIE